MKKYPIVLTIAGSDSSGGAGIEADIKTISALGAFATAAITAVTAQNTTGVAAIQGIEPEIVGKQIDAVFDDMRPDAVKIGMLHSREIIETVAKRLSFYKPAHVVLDPVMISTSGSKLLKEDAIRTITERLFPMTTLLTPNIPEAEELSGVKIQNKEDITAAARVLRELGCRSVLVKGGHLSGSEATDWLFIEEEKPMRLVEPRVETRNTHGTGCTLSSAIAAYLALSISFEFAVRLGKTYVNKAIANGAGIEVGHGHGPVNHLFHPSPLHKIILGYE